MIGSSLSAIKILCYGIISLRNCLQFYSSVICIFAFAARNKNINKYANLIVTTAAGLSLKMKAVCSQLLLIRAVAVIILQI